MTLDGVGHAWPYRPPLFTGVSRTFEAGRVCALVGPSGSGKSTLLAVLAGMLDPTEGTVSHVGPGRVLWVFQNPHGVAHRKAIDHVVFPFLAAGSTRGEAVELARPILASFKLTAVADRSFRELSGGEAQRLMLARAVATRPSLLLVDEPTAQLDLRTSETVNQTLGAVAQEGAIVLIATHDPGTRDACNRVIQLEDYAPTRGVAA